MLLACKVCRRQYDVTGIVPGESVRCGCGRLMLVPPPQAREARILRCSACGAPLPAEAGTCAHCAGEVMARDRDLGPPCPECFARLPNGARFCWECGVAIAPETLRLIPMSAACPRCRGRLVQRELAHGLLTECTGCAGIWLDDRTFEKAVASRDVGALAAFFGATPERHEPSAQGVLYLRCVTCGQLMQRKNFGHTSGVIIDWCKGHGYWFDTHELEKVLAFVAAGGLDKVREREIEEARAEVVRLRARPQPIEQKPVTPLDLLGVLARILLDRI